MAKETHKRISVWLNQQGIENNLKSVQKAITKTANELAKLPIGTEEWYRKSEKLKKLKDIHVELQKEIKTTSAEIEKQNRSHNNTIIKIGAISSAYSTASAAVRRFVSATQEYVDAYAKVDDLMQAVVKSSGLARKEIEQLRQSFTDFNTKTSTEDLLKIAEIGGHLGLTQEQLRDFVQYTDQAMQTIRLSAEEVANSFSKIQRQFSEVSGQDIAVTIRQAGSAMNALDSVTTSTEANIMAFTEAVGKLSDGIKPSLADTLALGAAFESAGLDAQQAAVGYARILTTARANIDKFADAMGRPAEEIRELINTRPAEFLLQFAESLRGLPTAEMGERLKDLSLGSAKLDATIGALTKNTDEFRTALATSAMEYDKASAMTENYNALNSTAAAQLELAKKKMQDAKEEMGKQLIPIMTKLYGILSSGAGWLKEHIGIVKAVVTVIGSYIAIVGIAKGVQIATNAVIAISNGLHKAHRLAVLAAAAAQSLFAKNTSRARAATILMRREVPVLTARMTALGTSIKRLGAAFKSLARFGPVAFFAAVAAAVVHVNREANEGKRIVEDLSKAASEAMSQGMADIEMEKIKIEDLRRVIHDENTTRDEKLRAIKELKSIMPEYVAELSEEGRVVNENTEAIERYIERRSLQVKADVYGDKLKELYSEQIRISEEAKKAREEYYGSFWGKVKQTALNEMDEVRNVFVRKLEPINNEIAETLQNIEDLEKEMRSLPNGNTTDVPSSQEETPSQGSDSDSDEEEAERRAREAAARAKEYANRWKRFQEQVASLRAKAAQDNLDDWEKVKTQTATKYDELIKDAEQFGKKGAALAKELEQEKLEAVAAAGQKYLEKYSKTLEDFSQKFRNWQKEAAPESSNEMVDAVIGARQKWIQRTNEVSAQMQELLDLRKLFVADNIDTTSLDALINKLGNEMTGMADLEAADIQKTLEKYQAQTDDFIKAEQKSITDATLTETQRQKNAIEEKYRMEIEHIEKTIAARIAAYGEDDPEVKQLRKKIQLLNQLKGQQQANVDKAAANSGPKSVWQQLAEFDWSKMSENWQSALGLMSQGLQAFANAAFDIYGSIAKIQNNIMEAELQKAQETYDAKSAALQRQLNQGVISQKAYDAKMQKLNEEKEKKERKLKHEQFAREKTANIIQATIAGMLAAVESFKNGGGFPWGLIPMALSAATTAVQIAAIASQPNPYYKGGYIHGRQYAVMGEQGDEWVASNKLLKDRETAAVIAALDDYQRGNRNALAGITFAAPD